MYFRTFRDVTLVPIIAAALCTMAHAGVINNTSLAPPGFYNGSGNANSNFEVDTEGNLELGLSIIKRFVGPINPGNSNVYVVTTSAGPLATWNFEFSVNTQAGGGTNLLANYIYSMTVSDVTAGTTGPTFDPVRAIMDNSGFGMSGKTNGVNVNTQWGAQNSENPGFTGFLPGFNANNHDLYKIVLTASLPTGGPVASVTVFADATAPEPASIGLVGLGVIGLAFIRKQKRRT